MNYFLFIFILNIVYGLRLNQLPPSLPPKEVSIIDTKQFLTYIIRLPEFPVTVEKQDVIVNLDAQSAHIKVKDSGLFINEQLLGGLQTDKIFQGEDYHIDIDFNCVIKDVQNVKIEVEQAQTNEQDLVQLKNAFNVQIQIPKIEIDNQFDVKLHTEENQTLDILAQKGKEDQIKRPNNIKWRREMVTEQGSNEKVEVFTPVLKNQPEKKKNHNTPQKDNQKASIETLIAKQEEQKMELEKMTAQVAQAREDIQQN